MMLDTCVSDTGTDEGCSIMTKTENVGLPADADRFSPEVIAKLVSGTMYRMPLDDCLGMCRFNNRGIGVQHLAELLKAATGWDFTTEELTTIGYGILDEAVNELKLADPSEILRHLYLKMHRFLKMEAEKTGISDDLDIALCSLDTRKRILTYSGIGNPLYHLNGGKLDEYRPGNLKKKRKNRAR
jgi:hypothetical protein